MILRHLNIIKKIVDQKNMYKEIKINMGYSLILKPLRTSEYKHMPYLCWIYNDDTQQEFIGINKCAVDMSNALPTDKK